MDDLDVSGTVGRETRSVSERDPPEYLSNTGQCPLSFVCAGSMSVSCTSVRAFGKKNQW